MTKEEIRSLVRNYLMKVDKTNKYHPEVIDATIERAFNQAFSDIFFKRPMSLDNYTVEYKGTGDGITISTDANTSIKYVTLPATYVPLPDKASGVRHVYSMTSDSTYSDFYPMTETEYDLMSEGVLSENVRGKYGYVVRDTIIELYGIGATDTLAKVRIRLLQNFREYANTDVVNMPFSRDIDLIRAVLELLGVVPPVDLKDDNAEVEVRKTPTLGSLLKQEVGGTSKT